MADVATDVRIRPLDELDLNGIVRIDEKITGIYRPEVWEQRVMYYLRRDPGASQVAESGGKVVGFMLGDLPRRRVRARGAERLDRALRHRPRPPRQGPGPRDVRSDVRALQSRGCDDACARSWIARGPRGGISQGDRIRRFAAHRARATDLRGTPHVDEGRDARAAEEVPRGGRALAPAQLQGLRPPPEVLGKYFPKDEPFCLCAKMELGTPDDGAGGRAQG